MVEGNTTVLFEVADEVARITLNRPEKRNALNDQLIAGLRDSLSRANNDDGVRAVILSGAGEDFCAGADLAALQKISGASVAENLEDARSLMELLVLIRSINVPVIAAVQGRALAGGCGLAFGCDMVLASRSARFGFPEVKIGFVPAIVLAVLRRNVSEKKAFELIAIGDQISAEEAERLGLVNRVLDDEAFADEVDAFLQPILRVSGSAISLSKRLLYQTDAMSFEDAVRCGVDTNVMARLTEDCRKGIERFLGKDENA